jgi:hypothetical protein
LADSGSFEAQMTQYSQNFIALHDINLDQEMLLKIKRNVLVPFMRNPTLLTHYADHIVQEQNQLLLSQSIQSSQQLSQVIRQLINQLNQSKKYFGQKKYNFIQRWFGIDLEQQAGSVNFLNDLNQLVEVATRLSHQVATEIYQSQKQMQQLEQLRVDMAHYVVAAEQFVQECHAFADNKMSLDPFKDRLHKKINTLMTSQSATDMAMLQQNLSRNTAMTILDRFNEAKNILIPAWQQHVLQLQTVQNPQELQQLNAARERLIQTLDHAVKTAPSK